MAGRKVYLFNPDNDLALAANVEHYTAPKNAQLLRQAGRMLPLWYGDEGSLMLCYGVNERWYEQMQRDFGISVDIYGHDYEADMVAEPWGWSKAARFSFCDDGFPTEALPDNAQLDRWRELSHRRTAARIARQLGELFPGLALTPPAAEVTDIQDIKRMLELGRRMYGKSPWSSSGRGVVSTDSVTPAVFVQRAEDALRTQGSFMIEEAYDRRLDFARIFEARYGRVADLGTSIFVTDSHNSYTGNLLAPESERCGRVREAFPHPAFGDVMEALRELIEREIAPSYSGIIGVDMLVTADGRLDPMVELNLRTTMGYVANRIQERFLAPEARGVFRVDRGPAPTPDCYEASGRRLRRGVLNLIESNPHFTIRVDCSPKV